mgnify:CR=1 FL=1
MAAVPGDVDTDHQPPMTVPLRHFVVGLGLFLAGLLVALGVALDAAGGYAVLSHVHLLLAGWVCLTIMGAMTQFVPVWSGTALHSRRLASVQLWLVTIGLVGFAGSLLAGHAALVPAFGGAMLLGFWTFVYNIARTLAALSSYDVTERHFGIALGFFVLVSTLGVLLAVDLVRPLLADSPVSRANVLGAHATLAVFGAVLTTVLGALYQLATMFTQTELHGIDVYLRRLEEAAYPTGVVLLALGRLLGVATLARVGGLLVVCSLLGFAVILARRLHETRVERTPMLSRYAVVVPALVLWGGLTLPAWFADPLSASAVFGAPGTVHLLVLGVIGFVVLGTLYHVVPFIVWVHRYSDLLGYEAVPMIDDLYDDRIATLDLVLLTGGTAVLVAADLLGLPGAAAAAGGGLLFVGALCFVANILQVIRAHSPHSLPGVLFETLQTDSPPRNEDGVDPVEPK